MQTKPIATWAAIHEAYFVCQDGTELMSVRTLRSYAHELYDCGACQRFTTVTGPKVVAIEPFFSLWRREKFRVLPKAKKHKKIMNRVIP